jgi:hypothetical protein
LQGSTTEDDDDGLYTKRYKSFIDGPRLLFSLPTKQSQREKKRKYEFAQHGSGEKRRKINNDKSREYQKNISLTG